MRKEEKKPEITAESELAPQLGSDKTDLVQGRFDMRRLSKINEIQVHVIGYFMNVPDLRGGRFWRKLTDNLLNLSVSVEGWRVNKMNQMVASAKGTPSVGELQKKPGWIKRNVTDKNWRRKAEEKGQTIVE